MERQETVPVCGTVGGRSPTTTKRPTTRWLHLVRWRRRRSWVHRSRCRSCRPPPDPATGTRPAVAGWSGHRLEQQTNGVQYPVPCFTSFRWFRFKDARSRSELHSRAPSDGTYTVCSANFLVKVLLSGFNRYEIWKLANQANVVFFCELHSSSRSTLVSLVCTQFYKDNGIYWTGEFCLACIRRLRDLILISVRFTWTANLQFGNWGLADVGSAAMMQIASIATSTACAILFSCC